MDKQIRFFKTSDTQIKDELEEVEQRINAITETGYEISDVLIFPLPLDQITFLKPQYITIVLKKTESPRTVKFLMYKYINFIKIETEDSLNEMAANGFRLVTVIAIPCLKCRNAEYYPILAIVERLL